jgi:alkylation response protein AidB-like acyl-CoA dehydrogenase
VMGDQLKGYFAMGSLERFRLETREWLKENCPESMRLPFGAKEPLPQGGRKTTCENPDTKVWMDRMGRKGWTAPTWPREYGGGGLSKEEAEVLSDEMKRISARSPLVSFGLWMIGPVLLEYGTKEQKLEHLPKIVRGEIWWCQGYSEPGAGSDLAGLQTSAVADGDSFVINGQKVWTSYADKADWIYALVRTSSDHKHGGITMILFDMESEGVSTRPIKLISGKSPFCETFFDNVRVSKLNVVGAVNGGWEVSNRLLQFERENVSADVFVAESRMDFPGISKEYLGEANGELADPIARDRLSNLMMQDTALRLTFKRVMEAKSTNESIGATSSIFKFVGAELNKDRIEYLVDTLGLNSQGWQGDYFGETELNVTRDWLRSKANSIEGGTTEINLNVIAKRVLELRDHS